MIKAAIQKSTFCNQILKTKQHVHCFWPVTKCIYRGRGGLSSFKYHNSREYHASDFNSSGSNNLSVAIVGSGPSGFYSAKYLQMAIHKAKENENSDDDNDNSTIHSMNQIDIDLIDRLPTPFGLVRSGVAPDHPEVKNVENDFIKVIQKANENDDDENMKSSMEFRGNVLIGKDVSLQELRDLYDVVILAYGCESDKKLGVEVERKNQQNYDSEKSLQGVYSAREFVAWYNGHPEYAHLGETFRRMLGDGHPETAEVVVIGQGNVALDCARILAKGSDNLLETDIASHALPILKNGIKHTSVVGRRGHIQGAFTIKELRELTKLEKEGCDTFFHVKEDELNAGATKASLEELKKSRPKTRIDKLLRDVAVASSTSSSSESLSSPSKRISLRFMLSPIKFIPDKNDENKIGSIICEKCELQGEPFHQSAVGTGIMEEIRANMVLVSIGYKGIPLDGMDETIFDEKRGIVRNNHGRVGGGEKGGLYVSGWLKRGPSGIIGTNITDAKDTVMSIIEDIMDNKIELSADNSNIKKGRDGLDTLLMERNIQKVDWANYEKIDASEKDPSRLRSKKQPREKFTSLNEMLSLTK